jgi:broad specificity phosphatase PhoE
MDVLLIRHGDPDYSNDTLTPLGHRQAHRLAEHLVTAGISRLYCSPMGRAQATAQPTAARVGLTPVTLPWLHELNGCYDGKHWCWSLPGAVSLDLPATPEHSTWHAFPPYGAHMKPIQDELGRCFDGLLAEFGCVRTGLRYRVTQESAEALALFCHGGLILTLISYLFSWPLQPVYAHLSYDPTGVTRLRWEVCDGYAVPRAKTINDLSHLYDQ